MAWASTPFRNFLRLSGCGQSSYRDSLKGVFRYCGQADRPVIGSAVTRSYRCVAVPGEPWKVSAEKRLKRGVLTWPLVGSGVAGGNVNFSSHQSANDEIPSPRLVGVTRDDSAGAYRLSVDNGFAGTYPYVWLRDNCRCPQCYHPSSGQRTFPLEDLDPDITPSSEELADEGRVLRVTWPDQHRSDFQADWLNRQRFSDSERDVVSSTELQPFGRELNGRIPTFEFDKLLGDDLELHNWLHTLITKGLALVRGAPTAKGAVLQLAKRVAYNKTTVYGETFQVFSKRDASNLAFTSQELSLHVDLPYYNYTPGVQMLHCIEQAGVSGGENQFVDGLSVAEQVRKEAPHTYHILRSRQIDFRDVGIDFVESHLKMSRPTIQYNEYGEFQRVNFNNPARAPYLLLPVSQVTDTYRAMKFFLDVMYRPEFLVEHKLSAGEIATFNNERVLHGRSAFVTAGASTRHLEGGYFDWDEGHSRLRILREKLFGDDAPL